MYWKHEGTDFGKRDPEHDGGHSSGVPLYILFIFNTITDIYMPVFFLFDFVVIVLTAAATTYTDCAAVTWCVIREHHCRFSFSLWCVCVCVCVCVRVCVQQHSVSGEGQQPASSSRSEKAWLVAKWYNFDTWSVLTVSEWACHHCLLYQHHNNYVCGWTSHVIGN